MSSFSSTLLHQAAAKGDAKLLLQYINEGYNVNERDENGKTPLHHAHENNEGLCAGILMCKGADTNIKDNNEKIPEEYIDNCQDDVDKLIMPKYKLIDIHQAIGRIHRSFEVNVKYPGFK